MPTWFRKRDFAPSLEGVPLSNNQSQARTQLAAG